MRVMCSLTSTHWCSFSFSFMAVNSVISLTEQFNWLRSAAQHWRRETSVSNPGLLCHWNYFFFHLWHFAFFCLDMSFQSWCYFFNLFIRSSSDTTSHIKPSLSGCTASSLWWGQLKGCSIRRCLSTKPGSTLYCAQTDHLTSLFSLWVRPSVLL